MKPLSRFWLLTSVGETDADSGVTWTKKTSYVWKPLARFWLLASVGETEYGSGVTWTGKNLGSVSSTNTKISEFF